MATMLIQLPLLGTLARQFALTGGRAWNSVGWAKARRIQIDAHPECYACGYTPPSSRHSNDVHHILPRHIAPLLVDAAFNLLTLCRKYDCHLRFGHFGDYRRYWNPEIIHMLNGLAWQMQNGEQEIKQYIEREGNGQ